MRKRRIGMAGVIMVVLALLAGCGAAGSAPEIGYDYAVEEASMEKAPAAPEPAYDGEASSSVDVDGEAAGAVERMIVWNAFISLVVEDTQESAGAAQALASRLGGYATSSESWQEDDQLHVRLTIRVPAARFDEAMGELRDMAIEVNRESANGEDVTDQYVDLESRLRHLEAKEAQLLEFLDEAEDTEAALNVYEHLAQTQGEIEQVKGRMAYLEKLSAMATITIELRPEEAEVEIVEEGWEPGGTLRRAARALVVTLEALGDLIIWLAVYVLPIVLVLLVPVLIVIWLVRRWRRSRRKPKDETQESPETPQAE